MRILIVDDEPGILQALKRLFRKQAWEISMAQNAEEALVSLNLQKPDLMCTDYRMPGSNGLELAEKALQMYPNLAIYMMSGNLQQELIPIAIRPRLKLFSKPWNEFQLLDSIKQIESAL